MMRNMLLAVVCTVSFGIVQAQPVPTATSKAADVPTVTSNESSFYDQIPLVHNVIDFAKAHLSIRYRSGGTTTKGFDCSGFTRFCFNKFGISLPHSSAAQGHVGAPVEKELAQPGDLILFKGHSSGGNRIGHVGLITEVIGNRIKFIHSAWNGGVRYDYLSASYYKHRFMGIRRVAHLLAEK
jgi:lipoprotein Spr